MAKVPTEKADSFEAFAGLVELVDEVAKQFGGFDRMKKCIVYWRQLVEPEPPPDR